MQIRRMVAGAASLLTWVGVALPVAAADLPAAPPPAAPPPAVAGWTFTVTPYAWFPTVRSTVDLPLPRGGTASQDFSLNPGQILSNIRFGFMTAAEADYGRFALLTDILYANLGLGGSDARLREISGPQGRISIPVETQIGVGTGLGLLVWTAAGGYSLSSGPWGEIKGIAGARVLNLSDDTWYALSAAIPGPRGGIALDKGGSLSVNATEAYGVGGVTGRYNISNSGFFIPFYADVGSGSTPLTWQAMSGIGFQDKVADITLGYRYEAFENSSGKAVDNLSLGGVFLAASFHF